MEKVLTTSEKGVCFQMGRWWGKMIRLKFGRKPQGKLVIRIKVRSLFGAPGGKLEKVIESRIMPLREKYPYADIYIEVRD